MLSKTGDVRRRGKRKEQEEYGSIYRRFEPHWLWSRDVPERGSNTDLGSGGGAWTMWELRKSRLPRARERWGQRIIFQRRGVVGHMPQRAQGKVRTDSTCWIWWQKGPTMSFARRASAESWEKKPGCDTECQERKQGLTVPSRWLVFNVRERWSRTSKGRKVWSWKGVKHRTLLRQVWSLKQRHPWACWTLRTSGPSPGVSESESALQQDPQLLCSHIKA